MPNLLTRLFRRDPEITRYTVNDYINWLTNNGRYGLTQPYGMGVSYSGGKPAERIENSFEGYTYGGFKANPIVFGTMTARSSVFSEARFMWRRIEDGRPGDLFSDDALEVLRRPWPNGTTGELLSRMIQDVDLAGNSYLVNEGNRLRRLRPDWVQIVLSGDPRTDQDVDVMGYVYTPGGPDAGDGRSFMPDEVCHWSPIPDPDALYRGMSWLTPVVREIQGDSAAVDHKIAFFRNGATLGPIVKVPAGMTAAQFKDFVEASNAAHQGVDNAYRPMYVGGGADVTLQAATMQQLDFKALQGASETRICVAARVPAVIAGVSEGLAGSSLNAGNYGTAKRSFADGCLRPLWRSACAALMAIIEVPADAELWYDERDIAFLRDDEQDIAQIQQTQASTVSSLITAGFKPESTVTAVTANDFGKLEHTGLTSVQLMPPGSQDADGDGVPDAEAQAGEDYEAALDEFRSELSWHDEIVRKFNPDQLRDWRGRWALDGSIIDALKAQGGEQDAAHFDDAGNEGRYVDWSSYDPSTATYSLEFGDGEEAVAFDVEDADLERLYSALSVTRLRDTAGATTPQLVALATLGETDAVTLDNGYIDWSTRTPAGDYGFGVESDGEQFEFDLSPAEMDKLIASLALSTQTRESVRSYIERRDYYDLRDFRGRFRKASDRIGHALNEWLGGRGDADDPLGDESEFSTASLRSAAKEFGITVPRARRGASEKEKRDQLKLALLKDARQRFRGERDADADAPSGPVRMTLASPAFRDVDVGVYREKNGKVSLYRLSPTSQRRGAKVVSVDSLEALQQWGEDNGEPQVSSWAASERGAPVKKVAPKKAAVPVATPEPDRQSFDERIAVARQGSRVEDLPPVQIEIDASAGSETGRWRAKTVTGYDGPALGGLLAAATARVRDSGDQANSRLRFPDGRPMADWEIKLREGYPAAMREELEAQDAARRLKDAAAGDRHIKALDRAMEQSRLPADVVLWRGMRPSTVGMPDTDAVGFEWTDLGYVGTSSRRSTAANDFGGRGAVLRLLVPKGTPAIGIHGGGEGELLLARGRRFRVVAERRTPTGGREIDVEVLPDAAPTPAKKAAKKAVPAPTPDLSSLRAMPTEARRDALDERKLPELKAMLKAEGLPVSGRKRELVDRLVEALDADAPTDAPEVPTFNQPTPENPLGSFDSPPSRMTESPREGERLEWNGGIRKLRGVVVGERDASTGEKFLVLRLDDGTFQIFDARVLRPTTAPNPDAPDVEPPAEAAAQRGRAALEAVPVHVSTRSIGGGTDDVRGLDSLTPRQRESITDAVDAYRGLGYKGVNDYLRSGAQVRGAKGVVAGVDRAMDVSALPTPIVVYRGVGNGETTFGPSADWPDDLTGVEWTDAGYASTSASRDIAARGGGAVQLRIVAPEGTKAIKTSEFEQEILLQRGLTFRVVRDNGPEDFVDGFGETHHADRMLDVEIVPGSDTSRSTTPDADDDESDDDFDDDEALRAAVDGDEFQAYWTRGKGLARWSTKPHPWRTLRRLLRKHPGIRDAEGLASHYFHVVFGYWPGHRAGDNPVGPG